MSPPQIDISWEETSTQCLSFHSYPPNWNAKAFLPSFTLTRPQIQTKIRNFQSFETGYFAKNPPIVLSSCHMAFSSISQDYSFNFDSRGTEKKLRALNIQIIKHTVQYFSWQGSQDLGVKKLRHKYGSYILNSSFKYPEKLKIQLTTTIIFTVTVNYEKLVQKIASI